jgi:hypothetical protein
VLLRRGPEGGGMTGINAALRDHVTGSAFSLTLRKTHISTLAYLDWRLAQDKSANEFCRDGDYVGLPFFVSGVSGLIRRGLVLHFDPYPPRTDTSHAKFSEFYQITEAGRLVIGLLIEAGLWQEAAAAYPAVRPTEAVAAA